MKLLDISLDGSDTGKVRRREDTEVAARFLTDNPTAKIVVVVDTHCVENGSFVWKGAKSNYQACGMDEVGVIFP